LTSVQRQRAFESFVRVRFHEADRLGHVNNAAYLNYLEQAAIDHATALGLGWEEMERFGGVFVARRHEIDFLRPAFAGDLLRIVTWLSNPRGAAIERIYLVVREADPDRTFPARGRMFAGGEDVPEDSLVARAKTNWVFAALDGRPRRIPRELAALFPAESTPSKDGA
jgi:acyl-CoA thioester hydrolase